MLIEFTGSSGSGKSTLAQALLKRMDEGKVLTNLNPAHPTLGNIYWDLKSLARLPDLRLKHGPLLDTAMDILRPFRDFPLAKLNALRSLMRKLGTYEFLAEKCRNGRIGLIDEGISHAPYVLFANPACRFDTDDLSRIAELIPLADRIVHVHAPVPLLVTRLRNRSDPPRRFASPDQAGPFIENSQALFEKLIAHPRIKDRIISVSGEAPTEETVEYLLREINK